MNLLNLPEHIRILEELLLHQDFSTSPEQLESMLDSNFREINPKGEEISRESVINWLLAKDTSLRWEFSEFDVTPLSDDLVLATYFARQLYPEGASSGGARHCSIWRENKTGKMWQLVFHQSTKTS